MDKISKMGLAVTVLLLVGWFYWQGQQGKNKRGLSPPAGGAEAEIGAVKNAVSPPAAEVSIPPLPETTGVAPAGPDKPGLIPFPPSLPAVELETDLMTVKLSPFGGVIQKLVLKENPDAGIRKFPDEKTGAVTLFSADSLENAPGRIMNFEPSLMEVKRFTGGVEFARLVDNKLALVKRYTFDEKRYTARLQLTIRNESNETINWEYGLLFACGALYPIDPEDLLGVDVLLSDGKIIRKKEETPTTPERISWLGLKTKYFTAIFKPVDRTASSFVVEGRKRSSTAKQAVIGCARGAVASPYEYLKASMGFERFSLQPGDQVEYSFLLYFGPANYQILMETGYDFDKVVDLGLLRPVSIAIIWLLGKIYGVIGSFGWAIIILTVISKIVLWPLTHKSYSSMGKMQKLQPKIAVLKEKCKNDPKKLQAETMKLYKEHGVNPMGGCLPMLLQMPILFALFTTLRNTILLRKASFWIIPGKWIKDLSGPDILMTLEKAYPIIGNQLNILPLLMGLSFFLQQKFTPTTSAGSAQAAQQQKMMSTMMPILFTFMFYTLPAGLNLYFMLSTFITVAQQVIVTKRDGGGA